MPALDISPHDETSPGTPEPLRNTLRQAALILLLSLTLNLAGNGARGLWDRDEPRYAGCTREMIQSGDWIHPTFNAEPRYHKPILIYWLMMAAMRAVGDNPFGARLASSIAGTAACLAVWALARRMFGNRAGLLAGLMFATAPIAVANAKMATTDATLLLFFVGCQAALWELSRAESKRWAAVFWVSFALAVLTKGPVAPAFLATSAVVSWWWGGPTVCWRRLHWRWGVPGFLILTLPWYIAIGIISHGDFYRVAMGYHVMRRMTTGIETHGGFPGYYVALSLLTFYPWSALMPSALFAAWSKRRESPAMGFTLGWFLGPLIFLEIVQTKIIHYYLPAYPAWAMLGGWLVDRVAASELNLRRWALGRTSLAILTGIGIGAAAGFLAGAFVLPGELRWPCLALAIVLGPATIYALERFQSGATVRAAQVLVATWAVAMLMAGAWLLPAVEPFRVAPKVTLRLAEMVKKDHLVPVLGLFKPPSIVYDFGQPIETADNRAEMFDRVNEHGSIAIALTQMEIDVLRTDPRFQIDLREEVPGLDLENPLRDAGLHMAVLRRAPERSQTSPSLAGRGRKQTRVE